MNYYIEDFTESNYTNILEKFTPLYEFVSFDYENLNKENVVMWRHDVDCSLNRAYSLSQIERNLGIRATYFLHLQSSFYNVFEQTQAQIIKNISKNHNIGLHFDYGNCAINLKFSKNEIENRAKMEREILENYFNVRISVVSFHNPESANALELTSDYYAGMVNAYSKSFSQNFKYCSDSNGYWRFDRLQDLIGNNKKLHILTHPIWWVPEAMSPYDRIQRAANGRRDSCLRDYCELLKQYGRDNIK